MIRQFPDTQTDQNPFNFPFNVGGDPSAPCPLV